MDAPCPDLRLAQKLDQKGPIARSSAQFQPHLPQGPAEAGQGHRAVGSEGDDLGDHGIKLGRDVAALLHPGIHPDSGSGGHGQVDDPSRRGREPPLGILGIQAGLHGHPQGTGAFGGQAVPQGDLDLPLHQVHSVGLLRDGMLDLQAGVDLHEVEAPAWARPCSGLGRRVLVEELDGAGPLVAGGAGQSRRGPFHGLHDLVFEPRRRGLLDELLVPPLQ